MERDASGKPPQGRWSPRSSWLLLGASVALAALAIEPPSAAATPTPASIEVGVSSPPAPIGPTDVVVLTAETTEPVLPSPSEGRTSTVTVLEEEFEIVWQIETHPPPPGLFVPPVATPLMAEEEVGPLAPGIYLVTVEWRHVDDRDVSANLDPDHGMGTLELEVVPEPGGAPLAAVSAIALLFAARWCRRRPARSPRLGPRPRCGSRRVCA